MGARIVWTSTTRSQLQDAPSKANDPKWSTELRAIDSNIVDMIRMENTMSRSVALVPEPIHLKSLKA
ncbi:unnamed protein product [Symbiodinium pilosum]|uniref:Uncharacterized protein n=1 Tax=Symbiodinium pilosum TaxID=2952 RepID=A0A812VR64_SYMPI|nr:unnamed protein product [Symbiodinium pilosum]